VYRSISSVLLALLATAAGATAAHADTPPLVAYPASVTGIAQVRAIAEGAGKVWLAGDVNAFHPSLVSCIDEATGEKCAPSYPITLKDAGGVNQTDPVGIAIAHDGAMWVANFGDEDNAAGHPVGGVTRIDPATGASTTFTGAVTAPHAIVVGADGDLWVANDTNTISRLNPADGAARAGSPLATGATAAPDKTLFPIDLAVGHDGDVWATLSDGDSAVHSRYTRLDGTTGGVVAGYPKPTGGDRFPGPLTVGADGDVWISDGSSGQVSRLADTGANRPGYPKFKTPATGMATGLDGDVWLTGGNPAVVDRLDPATATSRAGYPLAMPTATDAITIAANGDPWVAVTQTDADRVVHINLSGSTVTPGGGDGGGGNDGGGGQTVPLPGPTPPALLPPGVGTPLLLPTPRDTTAPQLKLSGATTQRPGTSLALTVACPTEACTAGAAATLTVPGAGKAKTYKLAKVTHKVAKGKAITFKLVLSQTARTAVAKALRSRKTRNGVKAAVTVTATDAAGNARRAARTIKVKAAAAHASAAKHAANPETDTHLGPEAGAGHYLPGQSQTAQWHGCRKSDIQWYPTSLLTDQPTTSPSSHRYVTFTVGQHPTFSWKVKSGYRICGVEAFVTLASAETQGGQLLAWASYKSGPTSGSTAVDGKETTMVHMPAHLDSDQPDLKIYQGKTLGMYAFQAIAVYVKKR
jgi:streptogramin lyase